MYEELISALKEAGEDKSVTLATMTGETRYIYNMFKIITK